MIRTIARSPWLALAIAVLLAAPRLARAEGQDPPPGPPAPYQGPPQPYQGPPQPYQGPPQPYPPPPPPGNGPPVYGPGGPPVYSAPIYAPEEISDFDDTRPVPYGYTKVYRARKGLIIGGAVSLGSVYLATTLVAAIVDEVNKVDGTRTDITPLYIPVVGPFLEISQTDNSAARFFLTLSAAGQTAGAIMLIYGLTNPRTVLVRNDQLSIAPMIGNGASGLSVVGRF